MGEYGRTQVEAWSGLVTSGSCYCHCQSGFLKVTSQLSRPDLSRSPLATVIVIKGLVSPLA